MDETDEGLRVLQYAWDYFLAHAQARLTTFRFYLVYATALSAGMAATFDKDSHIIGLLCFLLAFLTVIHWQIDVRHRHIIRRAQTALIALEGFERFVTFTRIPELRLFSIEFAERERRRNLLTYSTLVSLVLLVFFTLSLGLGIFVLIWG